MLNYLNKLRDRYETRNDRMNKIKEIKSSDAHKIIDNNYLLFNESKTKLLLKINSANIDNSQNYSQISNNLLYIILFSNISTINYQFQKIKTLKILIIY